MSQMIKERKTWESTIQFYENHFYDFYNEIDKLKYDSRLKLCDKCNYYLKPMSYYNHKNKIIKKCIDNQHFQIIDTVDMVNLLFCVHCFKDKKIYLNIKKKMIKHLFECHKIIFSY